MINIKKSTHIKLTKMYLVSIEPVYSQGVGDYVMITNDIKNVEKLRMELFKYKDYLGTIGEDLEDWEFHEHVYKITNIKKNKKDCVYSGYMLFGRYNRGSYTYENCDYTTVNDNIEIVYECNTLKENFVQNNVNNSKKPTNINTFDILKK